MLQIASARDGAFLDVSRTPDDFFKLLVYKLMLSLAPKLVINVG